MSSLTWSSFRRKVQEAPSPLEAHHIACRAENLTFVQGEVPRLWGVLAECAPGVHEWSLSRICDLGVAPSLLLNPNLQREEVEQAFYVLQNEFSGENLRQMEALVAGGVVQKESGGYRTLISIFLARPADAAAALRLLSRIPGVGEEDLVGIVQAVEERAHRESAGHVRRSIASAPGFPPAVYRALLRAPWTDVILQNLFLVPEACADFRCRQVLLSFATLKRPAMLAELAPYLSAAEMGLAFQGAREAGLEYAAALLDRAGPEARAALSREDLLPLLESADPSIRLTAIRASAQVRSEETPVSRPAWRR